MLPRFEHRTSQSPSQCKNPSPLPYLWLLLKLTRLRPTNQIVDDLDSNSNVKIGLIQNQMTKSDEDYNIWLRTQWKSSYFWFNSNILTKIWWVLINFLSKCRLKGPKMGKSIKNNTIHQFLIDSDQFWTLLIKLIKLDQLLIKFLWLDWIHIKFNQFYYDDTDSNDKFGIWIEYVN